MVWIKEPLSENTWNGTEKQIEEWSSYTKLIEAWLPAGDFIFVVDNSGNYTLSNVGKFVTA